MLTKSHSMAARLFKQCRSLQRFRTSIGSLGTYSTDTTQTSQEGFGRTMRGWQIHEYGDCDILQCSDNIKIPNITSPSEVCIEVHTASVNPIDVIMMGKSCQAFNSLKNHF